jgi:glycerol kinase
VSLLLALDQGTTSSRALVVDDEGRVLASAAHEFPQHFPQPGLVEHDPEDLWRTQLAAALEALAAAGAGPGALAAIGIANQRETTLLWRRSDGRAVGPAIVWQDRRTAPRCAALREEGRAEAIRERTGLLPDPYFSATKLEWLLDTIPGARAAAERGELAFGTVDSWLLWRLTGGAAHRTDRTNASRTMLWNLAEERWDPELLELFRVPPAVLPEVLPSAVPAAAPFGPARLDATGPSVPVTGIAGDQQAALFGQAAWRPGAAKNTYGTGCFLLNFTGTALPRPPQGLLATAACAPVAGVVPQARAYAVEGSVFVAGAAVQWLRDGLGIIATAAETETLARSVPDSAGVVVVPAFAGLGAPYWDPAARGAILGLTRGASKAHVARATLEAIAHQVCDVVETMAGAGAAPALLRVDGGGCANNWLLQHQADLLGLPVERALHLETTALGAAYLAGLGAGVWRAEEVARLWQADRTFSPELPEPERAAARAQWARAVARVRGWA